MAEGLDYCGPVKMGHKIFCLYTFKKFMKECLGGYYLVINSTTIVTCGRQLMDIGYKYNSRKVLGFIAIEGGGRTEPGDPHLYPLPDNYYIFFI